MDNLSNSRKSGLNLEESLEHTERMFNRKWSNDMLNRYKELILWIFESCPSQLFVHVEKDQSIRFTTDNQRFTKNEGKLKKRIPNFTLFEPSGNFVIFIPEEIRHKINLGEYKTEKGNKNLVRYTPELAKDKSLADMKKFVSVSYHCLEGLDIDYSSLMMQKRIPTQMPEIEGNNHSLNNLDLEKPRLFDEINRDQIDEERKKVLRLIDERRGQADFRKKLLNAYSNKCAITGCKAVEVLEAAHIIPCKKSGADTVCNGILLRSDIHTLFDLGLIAIDSREWKLIVSSKLQGTDYTEFIGKAIALPSSSKDYPDKVALAWHRTEIFEKCQ